MTRTRAVWPCLCAALSACFAQDAALDLPCAVDADCGDALVCVQDRCRSEGTTVEQRCADGSIDPGDYCYFEPDIAMLEPAATVQHVAAVDLDGSTGTDLLLGIDDPSAPLQAYSGGAGGLTPHPISYDLDALLDGIDIPLADLEVELLAQSNVVPRAGGFEGVLLVRAAPQVGPPIVRLVRYLLVGDAVSFVPLGLDAKALELPVALAAGDFDGSGTLDLLAVGKADMAVGGNAIASAQFVAEVGELGLDDHPPGVQVEVGGKQSWLVRDVDADGRADLLSVDAPMEGPGRVFAAFGRADASQPLAAPTPRAVSEVPVAAIADVDLDGQLDLLVGHRDDERVLWFRALDGVLAKTATELAAPSADAVTAADLDGDGTSELVVANGDGTFVVPIIAGEAAAPIVMSQRGGRLLLVDAFDTRPGPDVLVAGLDAAGVAYARAGD
ncbi:MAG: VCBS repeat-containing protein [Nannocystaceae bacterium]